jgi:PAS domain S-box-containing protein
MSFLMKIKDDVQKFARVIQNVLKVDITIVDDGFIRVAGTGRFFNLIGHSIGEDTVFARTLVDGRSFFIDNPRNNALCDTCKDRDTCSEMAEICCPILLEGKAIGVIGFAVFDEVQKDNFVSTRESLLDFLNQMADLIASRVLEGEVLEKNKILRKELETIIDTIDEGILALNQRGEITHCSYSAGKILGIAEGNLVGKNIDSIIPELSAHIGKMRNISSRELVINNPRNTRIVFNTRVLMYNDTIQGTVVVIRTMTDIKKIINNVSGNTFNIYFEDIVGSSPALMEVREKALKAARGCSTVFITGESGTGKELFARAIHSAGKRRDKPFVAVNCAAIPESLLESELFGYEEGAFTGAKKGGKIGKFELANEGTVFLDEIGDMPLHLQTKLLRVLQERTIERLGGQHNVPLDVRILAATHKNIAKMMEEGELREDLFYRLNVIPINIPPLRERKEDIPVLMEYILEKSRKKLDKKIDDFENEIYDMFINYDWPGNIRELENAIEYAVNMENERLIGVKSIPQKFKRNCTALKIDNECSNSIMTIKELEKMAIINALKIFKGSREDAAKALGISRATFYRKLNEYNIKI